jgi:hypothetical protein
VLTFLVLNLICVTVCATATPAALAAPEFVNGLALPGALLDLSGGTDANTGRVGYFSDIHYDAKRQPWWGRTAAICCWSGPTTITA